MKTNPASLALLAGVWVAALLASPLNLRAATITVTSTADSGAGTLRAALASAANGDTINFSLTTPAKITLTSGELRVTNSLTLLGPGPDNLTVDGNYASRVFEIGSNTVVTLAGMTITRGNATGLGLSARGGGIFNDSATLTVSNCTISGNSATEAGGGIFNEGERGRSASLTVVNSTVSGNSAIYYGGGIFNGGYGSGNAALQIVNSTIAGNTANYGAGLYNDGYSGNVQSSITSSTIRRNSAYQGGAVKCVGAFGTASLDILNCTLSDNFAWQLGGGIYGDGGSGSVSLQIGNTILKAGDSGANIRNSGSVSVWSLGYNLSSDDGAGWLFSLGDQINVDPRLAPLRNNGGPTPTQALLENSPAIDAGDDTQAGSDQRGFARKAGAHVDIGAFERQPLDLPLRIASIERTSVGGARLSFTNTPGAIITVLFATDLSLPQTDWTDLGIALQPAAGQFQFIDSQVNSPQRFYRLRQD